MRVCTRTFLRLLKAKLFYLTALNCVLYSFVGIVDKIFEYR
eukprot:UN08121